MKKFVSMLLVLILAFSLCACQDKNSAQYEYEQSKIALENAEKQLEAVENDVAETNRQLEELERMQEALGN
jgi:peptidoglycan hydrolase CwlO-like protein